MSEPAEPILLKRVAALIAAALVTWALVLLIGGHSGILATLRTRGQLAELSALVASQEAANALLTEEIRRLKEDPFAVEQAAREELMMARKDEVILLVPDPEPETAPPPDPAADVIDVIAVVPARVEPRRSQK